MAACHSVAEQVYEQQLQEVEVKEPVIMVGGTSLIEGLPKGHGAASSGQGDGSPVCPVHWRRRCRAPRLGAAGGLRWTPWRSSR